MQRPSLETPTIAHLMQKDAGSGGLHDTAFCGSWPGHAKSSTSPLRGFGEFLGTTDTPVPASETAETAVNWIQDRTQPFFLTVSLGGVDDADSAYPLSSIDAAMGRVVDAVKSACAEPGSAMNWDDMVFISVSLPSCLGTPPLQVSATEASLKAPTVVYAPVADRHKKTVGVVFPKSLGAITSILDVAPSVLGFAGLSGLVESKHCADFFETLNTYAGFCNPLPLAGRDVSTLCLSGQRARYLDESEFGFNDSFVENISSECAASQSIGIACKVMSPLANLLANTPQTVSMCMDESCSHLLALSENVNTAVSSFTNKDSAGLMCRYFSDASIRSVGGSGMEALWYSVDDDLLNDATTGAIEPLTLRSRRMKIIAQPKGKLTLFDLSEDPGESQDVVSQQAYMCILEIGKRLLNEARRLSSSSTLTGRE